MLIVDQFKQFVGGKRLRYKVANQWVVDYMVVQDDKSLRYPYDVALEDRRLGPLP